MIVFGKARTLDRMRRFVDAQKKAGSPKKSGDGKMGEAKSGEARSGGAH
jgi:hypothetical protein